MPPDAETLARTSECGHARKVTGKGGKLKMNFFAPAFLCDERAAGEFGLVGLVVVLYSVLSSYFPAKGLKNLAAQR
jgi:hypothetical protein